MTDAEFLGYNSKLELIILNKKLPNSYVFYWPKNLWPIAHVIQMKYAFN